MFLIKKFSVLWSVIIISVSNSDKIRRITGGEELKTDKPYVVYLVRAAISPRPYDTWLCGGALVNSEFIVTSAACVDDVEFLFAIAGYRKYVTDDEIDKDPCTKTKKKKVIYTCTPLSYELDYSELSKWAYIDIALAKVESPYDFNDVTYRQVCSYIPTTIPINYEIKYQEPGIDALVFGWGHEKVWRQPDDSRNYNQQYMHYAACLIDDKEKCKEKYTAYPKMFKVIDKHMICTQSNGNINEAGDTIVETDVMVDGCSPQQKKLRDLDECVYVNKPWVVDETRRVVNSSGSHDDNKINSTTNIKNNITDFNKTENVNVSSVYAKASDVSNGTKNVSRRSGFCQNDHGGPLVAWVGSHEVLIGVASVFKVSVDSECVGPYLYTSTQCNGAFLDCVLTGGKGLRMPRRTYNICETPAVERGYDTVEKHISWMNHPAGPADNERYSPHKIYLNKEKIGANDRYDLPESNLNQGRFEEHVEYKAQESNINRATIGENEKYKVTEDYKNQEVVVENERIDLQERNTGVIGENRGVIGDNEYQVQERNINREPIGENEYKVQESDLNTGTFVEYQRYRAHENYDVGYNNYGEHRTEAKYSQWEYPRRPTYSNYAPHGIYSANLDPLKKRYAYKESYPLIEKYVGRDGYRPVAPRGIYTSNVEHPLHKKYAFKDNHPAFEMYAAKYKYGHNEDFSAFEKYKAKKKLSEETILIRPQRPLYL